MKYLILLFLISFSCYGQEKSAPAAIDSVQYKIQRLEKIVNYMSDQLQSSSGPFIGGVVCQVVGMGAIGIGALLDDKSTGDIVVVGGIVTSVAGLALIITSHSEIARAGRWRWYGDRLTVDF